MRIIHSALDVSVVVGDIDDHRVTHEGREISLSLIVFNFTTQPIVSGLRITAVQGYGNYVNADGQVGKREGSISLTDEHDLPPDVLDLAWRTAHAKVSLAALAPGADTTVIRT